MLERDPFSKEGVTDMQEIPKRDLYSIENDPKNQDTSIFGSVADVSHSEEIEKFSARKKTKAWVIGGMAIAVLILLIVVTFGFSLYRENIFLNERVVTSLEGPDKVSGDNTERFVFTYDNQNSVALENAVLLLRFPENFVPEERGGLKRDGTTSARVEIGKVDAKEKATIEVYGYFSGTTESAVFIRTTLQYSPKNISGVFNREVQKSIEMESSVMGVALMLPLESATGDVVDISVQYTNRGKDTIFSGRLQMEYPDGFTFQGADIRPSEGDAIWYLDSVEPGVTKTLKLRGRIEGDRGMSRKFTALVGVVRGDNSFLTYGKDERFLQLVSSPFSIRTLINGGNVRSASVGSGLTVTLNYVNEGDAGLRDAVVQATLEGNIFDDTKIQLKKGSYDATKRTVTWRASDIPELAFMEPKESGSIVFSIPVRTTIPIETTNDTQFTGAIMGSIDSVDVPDRIGTRRIVAQDWKNILLNSSVSTFLDLREASTNLNLSDVRFEVGKETELVVYVRIRNTFNNVSGGVFTLNVPSGVSFVEQISLEKNEIVSYNERSQQLLWEVGQVKAATGILSPDRVIAFRIRVTPQEYQAKESLALLNSIEFRGKDDFTGEAVNIVQDQISGSFVYLKGE